MTSDPISDMLARIRNAALARQELTRLPASTLKHKVADLLKAEGYVSDVREEEWGPDKHRTLTIVLKYNQDRGDCAFRGIRRVSRPGRPDPARAVRPRRLDPEHVAGPDDRQGSAPPQGGWRAPV